MLTGGGGVEFCPACLLRAGIGEGAESASPFEAMGGGLWQEAVGSMVGPYRLLEELGAGGFGIVFLAEQEQPVRRKVALKILRPGMDTRDVVVRFEAERQALALMDHPHIARVFDAGATGSGRPYFVMELVQGVPLTQYCDERRLAVGARLRLFLDVLAAVEHAHQKGVIHRDLKPSNILVSAEGGESVVKVIDFGIAKALHAELAARTVFTSLGTIMGTPQYMSPEQADWGAVYVDTRSDIYSLGVVLYELLTGSIPYNAVRLEEAGSIEIQRIIREEEPAKPSTKIAILGVSAATVALNRCLETAGLARQLRGDLDWIVMKCLEKDRERRYSTVGACAADILRYLRDEPVSAGSPSVLYRMKKSLRRHRGRVAAGVAVLASMVVGVTGVIWKWREASAARHVAELEAGRAGLEWRRAEDSLYMAHMVVAKHAYEEGRLGGFRELLEKHVPRRGDADVRGWEWYYLSSLLRRDLGGATVDAKPLRALDWSNARNEIAVAGDSGTIWFVDGDTGLRAWERRQHAASVLDVAWSPDGTMVAAAGADGFVIVWSRNHPAPIRMLRAWEGAARAVAWMHDGKSLCSGGDDRVLRHWDLASGRVLGSVRLDGAVGVLALHPREPKLLCALGPAGQHGHCIVTVAPGSVAATTRISGELGCADWSPDGLQLAGGDRGSSGLVDRLSPQGRKEQSWHHHHGPARSVDWSPEGRRLASCGDDGSVQTIEVPTGAVRGFNAGHDGAVTSVAWGPGGKRLASAGVDGTVRLWNPELSRFPCHERRFRGVVTGVAWSPDSRKLAVAAGAGEPAVHIIDVSQPGRSRLLHSDANFLWDVDWSPDGRRVAAVGGAGITTVWEVESGAVVSRHAGGGVGMQVKWSPDSRSVLVIARSDWNDSKGTSGIRVVDAASGEERAWIPLPRVERACWDRTGEVIVSCSNSGVVERWDWMRAKSLGTLVRGAEPLACVEYDPGWSRLLVTGRKGLEMVITDDGSRVFSRPGQSDVPGAAWLGDGSRYATVAFDGNLRIRHAETGEELLSLQAHPQDAFAVAWSPDGSKIATGGFDAMLRIWDSGRETGGPEAAGRLAPVVRKLDFSEEPVGLRIAERPVEAGERQIDLGSAYNGSFLEGWLPSNQWSVRSHKNLPGLREGLVELGGTVFDARGVVQLRGRELGESSGFPERVTEIRVGRKAAVLHFLHGVAWDVPVGTVVGWYRVHYEEGGLVEIPLVYGRNILDWSTHAGVRAHPAMAEAPEVFRDSNAYVRRTLGGQVRLFDFRWSNPRPAKTVTRIDFVSAMTRAAPFLVALTADSGRDP
jgi:WD40 repeat protein/serine/threonine protein kinase